MSLVQKYLARQIMASIGFVLLAFIALFTFFDFIRELGNVGTDGYRFEHAVLMVLFGIPARIYELIPIAALIGTIYALAQLATHSEFTILRVSGLSTMRAALFVMLPGLSLVAATFFVGEVLVTRAEGMTQRLQAQLQVGTLVQAFRSGVWVKDRLADGQGGFLTRFVNIGNLLPDGLISNIKIYEFDSALRLTSIRTATDGTYSGDATWLLRKVVDTRFAAPRSGSNAPSAAAVEKREEMSWRSELKPELLRVLQVRPERMDARNLAQYIRHLEENHQKTERYEIAFWQKVIYPFAVLVMMALALPFAYLQLRAGGISLRIFAGIMLGIGFYLLNNLFAHLGLLNTWPPLISAALPSLVALILAILGLRYAERQ